MQIKLIMITVLMLIILACNGQDKIVKSNIKNKSYIIIERDNKSTLFATFLIMDTRKAILERFIKPEEVGKLYPDKIKSRTLLVKLGNETELISLQEIFKIYHITEEEQKLPIVVDDIYVKDIENVLADKDYIVDTKSQLHPISKQKVLYIKTKKVIKPTYKVE